ncbi:MAG: hypothetical protein VYB08_19995 [Candidatus Latescibacterota bacterium]|nr:hypothetical protein [Candidatus Latescibacterota bacterium]
MMGGRMWLESEGMGHGSTFYFTIQFALQQGPKEWLSRIRDPSRKVPDRIHDSGRRCDSVQRRRAVPPGATDHRWLRRAQVAWAISPRIRFAVAGAP